MSIPIRPTTNPLPTTVPYPGTITYPVGPRVSGPSGWVCPVCGAGVSPYTTVCPCKKASTMSTVVTGTTTIPSTLRQPDINEEARITNKEPRIIHPNLEDEPSMSDGEGTTDDWYEPHQ